MPPLPRTFTPGPAGGAGWSGWSKPPLPSLRPPGPVPAGTPANPPKTVPPAPWAKTPGRLPGNGAPASQPYTSPPAPRGPGFGPSAQPKPKTPTSNPNTPKKPTPALGPNPGAALGGDAKLLLPPGFWIGGGAFLAAAAAAAKLFWPPPPGDGTEGTAQTQTQFVPGKPGQGGLVPGKQYRVKIFSVTGSTFDWRASSYNFSEGNGSYLAGQWGPVILNSPVSISTETTERDWRHWGLGFVPHDELVVIDGPGNRYSIYIQAGSGGYDSRRISSFSYQLERVDGTPELADQIESGHPPKPEIQQTNITQNIQVGDTNININPPIIPGANPVLPPPVSPPTPSSPTPTGTAGTAGATPTPTPAPSPQPQPAPPPTVNPGAPNTTAGTPANQTPTTGPRPSPGSAPSTGGGGSGSPSRGGGSSGAATAAGLIAGTSPGVAGLIGAINNSAKPKPQTPTGNPVVIPGSDTSTGPNSQPVSQTGTTVIPNTTTNTNTNTTTNTTTNANTTTNITNVTNTTNITNVTNTVTNTTNTVTNQINEAQQQQQNSQQQALDQLTNPTGQGTTTTTTTTTTTINQQLLDLQKKSDADLASTLAILGTLATMTALNQSTSTITTAIQNQPSPCAYPAYHPQNQAERAAISNKVDGVNTVLGTVTNVQIAEAKTGIANVANLIGTPVANGAQTVLGGLDSMQTWLGKFAKSLYLDKIYNGLTLMVSLHNAAMLSRNLAETIGFFIDSGLQALNLKKEDETPLDLGAELGKTIENFIRDIVGNDIYNSLSTNWKKLSAIYTAAVNILDNITAMLAGLAESMEIIGNYTGKIGNALKRGGVVLENAYNWMDDNLRLKTGRFAAIQKVVDGINQAEDVVNNLTEVTDTINESEELVNEIEKEWADMKERVTQGEGIKLTIETQNKIDSQGAPVSKPDLITPED